MGGSSSTIFHCPSVSFLAGTFDEDIGWMLTNTAPPLESETSTIINIHTFQKQFYVARNDGVVQFHKHTAF